MFQDKFFKYMYELNSKVNQGIERFEEKERNINAQDLKKK